MSVACPARTGAKPGVGILMDLRLDDISQARENRASNRASNSRLRTDLRALSMPDPCLASLRGPLLAVIIIRVSGVRVPPPA
jgi:hypothetical protein